MPHEMVMTEQRVVFSFRLATLISQTYGVLKLTYTRLPLATLHT
jgi:hypothetical protein